MSVFRVDLSQGTGRSAAGSLDNSLVGGYSIQRSIDLAGPNGTRRKLRDGETFTDVNYWKRFTTEVLPADQASLVVVEDDGSIWYDHDTNENTFPRSYSLTVDAASEYSDNVVEILEDNGSAAIFTQISVSTTGTDLTFRFNGLSNATMSIGNNSVQTFDRGDLAVTKIEVDNSQSGSAEATVNIFCTIKSIARS